MADDLDDAEQAILSYPATPEERFDNIPGALVIRRLVRHVRVLTTVVRDLKQRVEALEKATPPPSP